jgi:hypothetical protein
LNGAALEPSGRDPPSPLRDAEVEDPHPQQFLVGVQARAAYLDPSRAALVIVRRLTLIHFFQARAVSAGSRSVSMPG